MKTTEQKMEDLASEINMTFDGGGDTRLFLDEHNETNIYASAMSRERYEEMEKQLNEFCIKKDAYEIYAWNDGGGYDYWNRDGEVNYIQVTADIIDIDNVDAMELLDDMNECYDFFSQFDNTDEYYKLKEENTCN